MNRNLQGININDELSTDTLIIKIKQSYKYLLSRWILILALALLGALAGFLYAMFKKPVYRAIATFVLEEGDKAGGLAQYAGLANIAGINLGGGNGLFQSENILELYKSRRMIKTALLRSIPSSNESQQLIERYLEFKGLKDKWHDDPKLKNISFKDSSQFTVTHDSIFNRVISDINKNILVVGKSSKSPGIFQVEVKSEDQVFSKNFADEIVKTVNNFYIETKTRRTRENLANLQHQTDSVKAVMNNTIYSAAAIMDATPNLNPTRQRLRVAMESSRAGAETNKVILGELVKNLELMKMSSRREVPLIQLIDAPVYPLEKVALSRLKGLLLGTFLFTLLITFTLLVIKLFQADINN
jgi:hypothetical protein